MRRLAFLFLLAIKMATPACANDSPATVPREQAIRDYALARCISRSYRNEETTKDAQEVAAAYLQFNVNVREAEKIYDLISELLKLSYASQSGGELRLMRCIDFMNSKQIDAVINTR